MFTLELSSNFLELPNYAYTTPSQNRISCLTLRKEPYWLVDSTQPSGGNFEHEKAVLNFLPSAELLFYRELCPEINTK